MTIKEFIESSPLSLYSSSTDHFVHHRKYHSLFVQAIGDQRFNLLSHFEFELNLSGKRYYFLGLEHASLQASYLQAHIVQKQPWPILAFKIENQASLEFALLLSPDRANLHVYITFKHHHEANTEASIKLRPLLAFRNIHALSTHNNYVNKTLDFQQTSLTCQPYTGLPALQFFIHPQASKALACQKHFVQDFKWLKDVYYPEESARGYPAHEDLFSYGYFNLPLKHEQVMQVSVLSGQQENISHECAAKLMVKRQEIFDQHYNYTSSLLPYSARHFIVKDQHNSNILAGFPWFACWGRDALIALPGLLLTTECFEEAKAVLNSYASSLHQGLIPNTLDAKGRSASFNAIDATLWYAWAVSQYWQRTHDHDFIINTCWPALTDIYQHLKAATHENIFVDDKGFLHSGSPNTQLTWMDAQVDGNPVTPRYGYPIEVNALWYTLLSFMLEFPKTQGLDFHACKVQRQELQLDQQNFIKHFEQRYWRQKDQYFSDCLYIKDNTLQRSSQLRPNQCIAIALLPFLNKQNSIQALKQIETQLLTPYGLRTLSPKDPLYQGRYEGNQANRDQAYHNGTVWPWLLGFYIEACCKYASDQLPKAKQSLTSLQRYADLNKGGLIPEVFDGDEPQRAMGAIHQAWSVAEVLRSQALLS